MTKKLHDIPIRIESGVKYTNKSGIKAIKDGVKQRDAEVTVLAKPPWLKATLSNSEAYQKTKRIVEKHDLSTVCAEAKCPNISECWSHGTATLMLMGSVCTRACRFCAVDTGNPKGWLDTEEPLKAADAVEKMALNYVVLTSVDRDDIADGGAAHYAKAIFCIKQRCPTIKVEALCPDFGGQLAALHTLLDSPLDVFAQNLETVARLTHQVRDIRAGYQQTLALLAESKRYRPDVLTKTSLMLGLGEAKEEVHQAMRDMREAEVDILTLGQYLQPTKHHYPLERYVHPDEFEAYRKVGLDMGFFEVASGPLVRSSYRADKVFKKNNLGLD